MEIACCCGRGIPGTVFACFQRTGVDRLVSHENSGLSADRVLYDTLMRVASSVDGIASQQTELLAKQAQQSEAIVGIRSSLGRFEQELSAMDKASEAQRQAVDARFEAMDKRLAAHGRVVWLACIIGSLAGAVMVTVAGDAVMRSMSGRYSAPAPVPAPLPAPPPAIPVATLPHPQAGKAPPPTNEVPR